MHIVALILALVTLAGTFYAIGTFKTWWPSHSGRQAMCWFGSIVIALIELWAFFGKGTVELIGQGWQGYAGAILIGLIHIALLSVAFLWKDPKAGDTAFNRSDKDYL